nr:zinc finger, CCHC-type [Tanacetum cinerariifolium]
MNRGSILHDDLTYTLLHKKVMKKFNLEANYPLNLSAKLSSIDDNFDITDDHEVRFCVECACNSKDEVAHLYVSQHKTLYDTTSFLENHQQNTFYNFLEPTTLENIGPSNNITNTSFDNNGLDLNFETSDFQNNESNHQNESHFEKPKCSFAFRDYNEYEDEKNEFDDVVDDNPLPNYQKWQNYMSFKPDISETPLYKSKPMISKHYKKKQTLTPERYALKCFHFNECEWKIRATRWRKTEKFSITFLMMFTHVQNPKHILTIEMQTKRTVLSIEDKLNYLEQPIPPAPVPHAGQHVAPEILAAHTVWIKGSKEIAGLSRSFFRLHKIHSCKQEEGQSVSLYVLKMKGYIDNLERLGNPMTLGLGTINELHALLKLHEQTLPKNNAPALHSIRAVFSRVAEEEKECSFERWWFRNNMVYFSDIPRDGIFEIDLSNSYTNESFIYVVSNKRAKLDLDSALLWHCLLGHISKKLIEKLQHNGLLNSTDLRAFEKCVHCMSEKMARKPYTHQVERAKDLLRLIHTVDTMGYCFYYPPKNKVLVAWNAEFLKNSLITQEASGSLKDLEIIQEEDMHPSIDTSLNHEEDDQEIDEPQSDINPIRRSTRTRHAPYQMVNSMLSYYGLSQGFWGEAMLTACYLLNRVPNKKNKITHYELWTKKKPNINYLRVWGFRAAVRLPNPKLKTLGERGIECIFVGYAEHSKAYRSTSRLLTSGLQMNLQKKDEDGCEDNFLEWGSGRGGLYEPTPGFIMPGNENKVDLTKEFLSLRFSMKEMGEEDVILGIRIKDESNGISISQSHYIEKVLKKFNYSDFTPVSTPLDTKWIFKRKLKVDGTVEKFKARLVIHGFKQKSRIDYFDTYAPVARISTIRLLIAMASIHNLIIHQIDVKTAFLNEELEEDVYMNQYMGFILSGNENKVCKLIKSLYGLKQAPKKWHQKFNEVVFSNGYLLNQADKYVYSKFDASGKGVIICLYVDDMLIFGTDQVQVDLTKEFLSSRYTSNPGTQHWQAIQRVLKYLKKTMNYRLVYSGYPLVLEGYTDASWISNTEDNSSTSGWVFLLGGGAISWASKKQTCITGSTMEFEFVALAATGKEAEWLKNLLFENPLRVKPMASISIRCDSAATLAKAYSHMYNGKSRHLGVRHSMIRELIMNGVVSIEFVRSQQNLADHLTKGLSRANPRTIINGINQSSI